jgi:putative redox protein
MEMLLLGVGGCSAFDVIMILEKPRQKMLDCRVEVDGERTEEPPRVFTKINMKFIVNGHALNEDQVNRAIELSATKYCGASTMMEAAGSEVKRSCEIIQL